MEILSANRLLGQPSPLGYIACASVAFVFLLRGIFGLKSKPVSNDKANSSNHQSVWPTWFEPLFYVVVGLAVLALSVWKLRR
jgi:hypothetical protein